MAVIIGAAVLIQAQLGIAGQVADINNVDHYVWDLSSLYPDQAAWEAERATIESKLKVIGKLRGTLRQIVHAGQQQCRLAGFGARFFKTALPQVVLFMLSP